MLKVIPVSQSQRREILDLVTGYSPGPTWLVADYDCQRLVQKKIGSREKLMDGDRVLCAADFWSKLYFRVRPDVKLVSPDFVQILIRKYLEKIESKWLKTPGSPRVLFKYMNLLSPLLSHPEGYQRLRDWFVGNSENLRSFDLWGAWFVAAQECWNHFKNMRIATSSWAPALLLHEDRISEFWNRPLVVDLGGNLTSTEVEHLTLLSQGIDVQVLMPPGVENMASYQQLSGELPHIDPCSKNSTMCLALSRNVGPLERRRFYKYATMLSEVKDVVSQIRVSLDSGIPSSRIAVVALGDDHYRTCLQNHLKMEGVELGGDDSVPLHTFPEVAQWLARLRLHIGIPVTADLEQFLFGFRQESVITFEQFHRQYSRIYSRKDLSRSKSVRDLIVDVNEDLALTRDQFVDWALRLWPENGDDEIIEKIVLTFFQDAPGSVRLKLAEWSHQVQALTARLTFATNDSDSGGDESRIQYCRLSSLKYLDVDRVFVLGLCDENLKKSSSSNSTLNLSSRDVFSISHQIGFNLDSGGRSDEIDLCNFLHESRAEISIGFSQTDFSGSILTPSSIWMEGALQNNGSPQIKRPDLTRWDELQLAPVELIALERGWSLENFQLLLKQYSWDTQGQEFDSWGTPKIEKLSASSFESYFRCPYTFGVKQLLKLSDQEPIDLSVDRLIGGKILHEVLFRLLAPPVKLNWSQDEIEVLLEDIRRKSDLLEMNEVVWLGMRRKYVRISMDFLSFEKKWRSQFPLTQTVGRELRVSGFFNPETGDLQPTAAMESAVPYSGSIDRVDSDDENHVVVLDYKSGPNQSVSFENWISKGAFQLPLYARALENGLTELGSVETWGAFFYDTKNLNRNRGFRASEGLDRLYAPLRYGRKSVVNQEERTDFYERFRRELSGLFRKMSQGEMHARPRDMKICDHCYWRTTCRSPHLN